MSCICEQLRNGTAEEVSLEFGRYTDLGMRYGELIASGDDFAIASIRFCPLCGKEFV